MYLLALVLAGLAAWAAIWALQPFAARLGLLDHPHSDRKHHVQPTPVTGGPGMLLALVVLFACLPIPITPGVRAFLLGSLLLAVVGVLDDLHDLRWWWRILAQGVAALVMVYLGDVRVEQLGRVFGVGDLSLGMLSVPFTVFATVGLINAVNMIDGADGIGGILVAAALAMLAAAGLYAGNLSMVHMSLALLAVVLGFLAHNFPTPWRPRARVFMGNAGSAFLGYAIAWIVLRLTQTQGHPVSPVLALWLVPIPVIDCLVLIVRRARQGRSPFAADRDHIHHIMRDAGFSAGGLALLLAGVSLVLGLGAALAMLADIPDPWLLVAFIAACTGWLWLTTDRPRAVTFMRRLYVRFPARRAVDDRTDAAAPQTSDARSP